jgi:hypothetical protein
MLPTVIIDYKIDFRYFLIASGAGSVQNQPKYDDKCFIDDIVPPVRKHFTVDQYFKKMQRIYEDDEDFSEYEISINELK